MKTSPENTSRRSPEVHLAGMLGGSDSYITGMESDGQRQLVASSVLPKEGPWAELIALGFVKGEDVDDLFVRATLPDGWSKEGSDHAMHSYLMDARGVKRVNVFYKAAFYDRRAGMHLMDPGYTASADALYGDDAPALPEKWDVFTEGERASFAAGLDSMAAKISETPSVYGKYADRLKRVRALLADGSS